MCMLPIGHCRTALQDSVFGPYVLVILNDNRELHTFTMYSVMPLFSRLISMLTKIITVLLILITIMLKSSTA